VAWGKLADICGQYLKKGRKAYVEGRLRTRDWVGQDGVKRYRTEIIADNMIILDRAPGAPAATGAQYVPASQPTHPPTNTTAEMPAVMEEEVKLEDIPF
jgi:single-strand DNA-binding protein